MQATFSAGQHGRKRCAQVKALIIHPFVYLTPPISSRSAESPQSFSWLSTPPQCGHPNAMWPFSPPQGLHIYRRVGLEPPILEVASIASEMGIGGSRMPVPFSNRESLHLSYSPSEPPSSIVEPSLGGFASWHLLSALTLPSGVKLPPSHVYPSAS